MTQPDPPNPLPYATPGDTALAARQWQRRWYRILAAILQRTPLAVIALLLLLPITLTMAYADRWWRFHPVTPYAYRVFVLVALLLPGSVRRLRLRHCLLALAAVVPIYALTFAIGHLYPDRFYFSGHLLQNALLIAVVGTTELHISRQASWPRIIWTAAAGLALWSAFAIVQSHIQCSDIWIRLPFTGAGVTHVPLAAYLTDPLVALATWMATPLGIQLVTAGRTAKWVVAATTATTSGAYILATSWLFFVAADHSLSGRGPYSRAYGVSLLAYRARETDFDRIAAEIRRTDWMQPAPPYGADGGGHYQGDWRQWAVENLVVHDPAKAAEELSHLLCEHPSPLLASTSAKVLCEQRRYETIPLLLRYAMASLGGRQSGGWGCWEPLEQMGLPHSALGILREVVGEYRAAPQNGATPRPQQRSRLTKLLGQDLGSDATLWDWADLYDRTIDQLPSPLPANASLEVQRVHACCTRYLTTANRLHKYREQKMQQMVAVPDPDWTAPTTDQLENEVDKYVDRVTKVLEAQVP